MIAPFATSPVPRNSGSGPSLLVSVRTADEAVRAIAGGADLIDVKEPLRGSLGRPLASTVDAIADLMSNEFSLPLSVAVGELREFHEFSPSMAPEQVSLSKMGLAGMQADPQWRGRWVDARQRIDSASGRPLDWVAVAYADAEAAQSPAISEIVDAAIETGCAGVLIDTFDKSGGSLLDLLSVDRLDQLANEVHGQGLFLAVAGRLSIDDLRVLRETACDVVGVRSAVCLGEARSRRLIRERVTLCRTALAQGLRFSAPFSAPSAN